MAVQNQTPHPAVVRIVVQGENSQSFGSGTLIYVTGEYGLVITNWHVVRDAKGPVEVIFADGFRSGGKVMKVDNAWDLAAVAIWKPKVTPVELATQPPKPGEPLTIAGYGGGRYRAARGPCTQYVSPGDNHPFEMIELAAAARQGDSGGPIFNSRGQLAGVLLGEGQGRTVGSYCGRVSTFLADVTPALGRPQAEAIASRVTIPPRTDKLVAIPRRRPAASNQPRLESASPTRASPSHVAKMPPPRTEQHAHNGGTDLASRGSRSWRRSGQTTAPASISARPASSRDSIPLNELLGKTRGEQIKTILAAIGALSLIVVTFRMLPSE